jgi:cytochrome c553
MRIAILVTAALMAAASVASAAGDAAAGRKKARMCQTCHGMDGLSKHPQTPHISGQLESYLVKTLVDYRDGVRTDEMMSVVAPNLTEADIADLAAYYASIKITVTPP